MVGSSAFTSTKLEMGHQSQKGHLDQTLSFSIPLQIGILFDAEVCSSLAIQFLTESDSRCFSLYFLDFQLIFN